MSKRIVTLLTDFGNTDGFVGTMKGVIFSICSDVEIIDISNDIPSHDVFYGAFVLKGSYSFFPKGTIHLAVVDPGVGSEREAIVVKTKDYFFIGPDNGLFSYVIDKNSKIYSLENKKYFLKNVSQTFHGRDIFAPIAGYLAKGISPEKFGKLKRNYKKINLPKPKIFPATGRTTSGRKYKIVGQIIYIDKFGNLITNIHQELINKIIKTKKVSIKFKNVEKIKIVNSYSEIGSDKFCGLINSFGYLEVASNKARAESITNARLGDEIILYENF
jgi:S-adenosylmethionine hydrolase